MISVYVHVPFCPSKCGYCDFNSYAMEGEIVDRTLDAMTTEILRSPWRGTPARTVFLGGGTPTYVPTERLVGLLQAVTEVHPPAIDAEITSEANPGTVDAEKFSAMRQAGFNRLSLGAQSFDNGDLHRLGRVHSAGEIERAVGAAREAGFENLNLDLMFALPTQASRGWTDNLDRAIALRPEHLSLYCLTLEPNTAFYKEHLRGRLILPDDSVQVEMYDEAVDRAAQAGYAQYEISNFALPGRECRHNLAYWRGESYAGYGPGAVGCMPDDSGRMVRTTNLKHPERYAERIQSGMGVVYEHDPLDEDKLRMERIMLGLRLNEGLGIDGCNLTAEGLAQVVERGWAKVSDGRLALTAQGRHFCSEAALALC